ncbi:hypothetical protein AOLI_G00231360 [Acnodon oligacanthus]
MSVECAKPLSTCPGQSIPKCQPKPVNRQASQNREGAGGKESLDLSKSCECRSCGRPLHLMVDRSAERVPKAAASLATEREYEARVVDIEIERWKGVICWKLWMAWPGFVLFFSCGDSRKKNFHVASACFPPLERRWTVTAG